MKVDHEVMKEPGMKEAKPSSGSENIPESISEPPVPSLKPSSVTVLGMNFGNFTINFNFICFHWNNLASVDWLGTSKTPDYVTVDQSILCIPFTYEKPAVDTPCLWFVLVCSIIHYGKCPCVGELSPITLRGDRDFYP